MKQTINKLNIPDGESFESIMEQRNNGGKFVFYEYLIPRPIVTPGRGASKIYFIRKGEKTNYNIKYNAITLLWGWWGLPFGPVYIPKTLSNNKNGIDVTEDVYNNLTKEDFIKHQVVIKNISQVFMTLEKGSFKELTKCFKKYNIKQNTFVNAPIVSLYIDTDIPTITIGLSAEDIDKEADLKIEVYKYFYKNNLFKFINIDDGSELATKLKEQGESIKL